MFTAQKLGKYSLEIIVYIILTRKKYLRIDICSKIVQKLKNSKSIIKAMWNTEVRCQ